jgi:hypothetical protein
MLGLCWSLKTRRHIDLDVKNQNLSKTWLILDENSSMLFLLFFLNKYLHTFIHKKDEDAISQNEDNFNNKQIK